MLRGMRGRCVGGVGKVGAGRARWSSGGGEWRDIIEGGVAVKMIN